MDKLDILIRLLQAGHITKEEFKVLYEKEYLWWPTVTTPTYPWTPNIPYITYTT